MFYFFHKVSGIELVEKLHALTRCDIRVPTGYLGNYKFSKIKIGNDLSYIEGGTLCNNTKLSYPNTMKTRFHTNAIITQNVLEFF